MWQVGGRYIKMSELNSWLAGVWPPAQKNTLRHSVVFGCECRAFKRRVELRRNDIITIKSTKNNVS